MFGAKVSISLVVVAVFSYYLESLIQILGLNRRVYNHVPGECSSVGQFSDGISGFDTAFDGTVFLTSGRCFENCSMSDGGKVFVFSADNKTAWELQLKNSKTVLNPGSISVTPSRNKVHVVIINHKKRDRIEIFFYDYKTRKMRHVRSVKNKTFKNLIDVASVDKEKFFTTSHAYFSNSYLQIMEKILNLNTGSIVYFDGKTPKVVSKIPSPTGIIYDKFRKFHKILGDSLDRDFREQFKTLLFVASFSQEALRVYKVEEDYTLTFLNDINLYCSPYSVWRDIDNSMIVTCHPVMLRYFSYQQNQTLYFSPTLILRVHYRSNGESVINQLYSNDGATISAATSAIRTGNMLLIGARKEMLSCELNYFKEEPRSGV